VVIGKQALWSVALFALASSAGAQDQYIRLDGSLGPDVPVPVTVVDLGEGRQARHYEISDTLGAFSPGDENLFFSFSKFKIPTDGSATFVSALFPERVVARVTGDERSFIDGVLRCAIPGADLYLLNPNGVTLEAGANVQMSEGSLYVSTADLLRFGPDEPAFDAHDTTENPSLSSAHPSAFGFLGRNPKRIELARPAGLSVPAGQTLSFVGTDEPRAAGDPLQGIMIHGVLWGPAIVTAPGATLQLASAGAAAAVDIPVNLGDLDPAEMPPGSLGDVVIGRNALIRMNSFGETPAGRVVIRGERFVLDRSAIEASNDAALPAAGPIDIAVSGAIEIEPDSVITTRTSGTKAAGGISLRADSLTVTGDATGVAWIRSWATNEADGAPIEIDARSVTLQGGAAVSSLTNNAGGGGGIAVVAESFEVRDGATVKSEAIGAGTEAGTGGAIQIAADSVVVADGGVIQSLADAGGDGGAIQIAADSVVVADGGVIESLADAGGDGGAIEITAGSLIVRKEVDRDEATHIASIAGDEVEVRPEGEEVQGGALTVRADTVNLVGGGQLITRTEGAGNAGALSVLDADTVAMTGRDAGDAPSGITSRAIKAATGDGGLLTVDTRVLFVGNGAELSSATKSRGDAGKLVIRASEEVVVDGGEYGNSLISSSSVATGDNPVVLGNGGDLSITTRALELTGGGQVTASAMGTSDAGDVEIRAERVEIAGAGGPGSANASGVFSRSNTQGLPEGYVSGRGGELTILAEEDVLISGRGRVSVSTNGPGHAGSILLVAGGTVDLSSDASITALSQDTGSGGDGGAITVWADRVLQSGGSEIAARSQGSGLAGNITIHALERFESEDSAVTTEASHSSGGQVAIDAGTSVYLDNAEIATNVIDGTGGGGDVLVQAPFVTLDGGRILAGADEGAAGNITIASDTFLSSTPLIVNEQMQIPGVGRTSILDATSGDPALSGEVEIDAPDTDLIAKLEPLPASFLDASALLGGPCAARTERAGSFTIVGREAVPVPPDAELPPIGAAPAEAAPIDGCSLGEETP
jgi:filamentous hemagglutinin family protein